MKTVRIADLRGEIWIQNVGSEVLTPVVMKSSIIWDITPCSPLKVDWRFGRTCRLHLRSSECYFFILVSCLAYPSTLKFPAWLTLRPWSFLLGLPFDPEVSCLVYSSTLKMEATCSSEISVDFQRITRRYIPEDRTLRKFGTTWIRIPFNREFRVFSNLVWHM
jgi:hypothetical protein